MKENKCEMTKHDLRLLASVKIKLERNEALRCGKYIIKSEHDPKEVADMVEVINAGYTRDDVPAAA